MIPSDDVLAFAELYADAVFSKIPEERYRYYVDGSMNAGYEAARRFSGMSASELAEELSGVPLVDRDGRTAEKLQELLNTEGCLAVKAEGQGLIYTEKKVSLMSEGCQLRDEHTVLTAGEGVSYIIAE